MKIEKNGIPEEDKEYAIQILNDIRNRNRCIGNPAQGLKITLKGLEEKKNSVDNSPTTWLLKDKELISQINMVKAGIEGEEKCSDFLSQLLKYNDDLDGCVAFASLSQDQENNKLDYIPDSDIMVVHLNNFLIIDAKNISTSPDVPIKLVGNDIMAAVGKSPKIILPGIHSSVNVWAKYFDSVGVKYNSIKNIICIVNESGAYIVEPEDTDMELLHIVDLQDYLMEWYKLPTDVDYIRLYDLLQIAKCQIRKEKSDLDLTNMKRLFGV